MQELYKYNLYMLACLFELVFFTSEIPAVENCSPECFYIKCLIYLPSHRCMDKGKVQFYIGLGKRRL